MGILRGPPCRGRCHSPVLNVGHFVPKATVTSREGCGLEWLNGVMGSSEVSGIGQVYSGPSACYLCNPEQVVEFL